MIKYKGYSVYPREVEEALFVHDCVADAAVIGVPHVEYGELVKAFVVLRRGCEGKVNEQDIIDHCKKYLVPCAVPKMLEFRDQLPKSGVGKTLRYKLREEEIGKGEQGS